ncbi:MAG: phenylacetate--CoA ligase family protein [Aquabacterium sp.]|uniref:phenylacetate--CoA ligase family protein n=1 Tax=Aquabacterium sp. TaxID=1872578 RepID=UPI00343CE0B7|nr:phenylacetate--CoA ligase family protein [Aquabacterium sp.]
MYEKSREIDLFKSAFGEIANSYRRGGLTLAQLNDWKAHQLRQVLAHVQARSPFYARQLAGVDIGTIGLNTMSRLPFTTKDDLRIQMGNMLSGTYRDAAFYYETTGTTGPATPCPRDVKESFASNLQLRFAYEDVVAANFPAQHAPILGILGPSEVHSFSDTLEEIAKDLGICSVKAWPGSPVIGFDKCLSLLKDLQIDMVATSPGQVMTLAKEARRRGLDPKRDFSVKAFMLSGELCTPELAANLKSIWGAEIYNSLYGSQEAFVIASTTADNTLRPHLTNYVFEIVDPKTGEVLDNDQIGELVVTNLVAGVKPLIRYRTGDVVRMTDTGHADLYRRYRLEVVGRVKDSVTLNGVDYTAAQIEAAIMSGVTQCYGYQIIITHKNGEDAIIAKLELPGRPESELRSLVDSIGANISSRLGCSGTVMGVEDLSEHVNLGGWIKWKAARLIDTREAQEDEGAGVTGDLLKRLNTA